jgi:hypothetical protein
VSHKKAIKNKTQKGNKTSNNQQKERIKGPPPFSRWAPVSENAQRARASDVSQQQKQLLVCGNTEGKKHPPFFEFFQSIKFFLMCLQKNVRRVLLTPREI